MERSMSKAGLDNRHRNKDGEISHKHGNPPAFTASVPKIALGIRGNFRAAVSCLRLPANDEGTS